MNSKDNHTHQGIEDRVLIRYLLGELSEREQERLEEQLFTGEHYDQLLAVEENLVEGYLRGKLNARDRARFEGHYLASPRRRERVEFTRTLFDVLGRSAVDKAVPAPALGPASPVWRFALAAAWLILLAGGVWLAIENLRLRSQSQQLRAELTEAKQQHQHQLAEQQARNEQLKKELLSALNEPERFRQAPSETTKPPSSLLAFAFTLNNPSRSTSSDEERTRLVIPRDARQLRLQLEFSSTESYRSYIASVQTPEGSRIASQRANFLAPGKVVLTLNAGLFRTNDYILTLKGSTETKEVEEIADYQFTLVKR